MSSGISGTDLYTEAMTLRYKVESLERAGHKHAEQLKEARLTIRRLQREVERLKGELNPANTHEEGYNIKWPWTTKVIFVLRTVGLPLRDRDILDELQKIDDTLFKKPNPASYLSVILTQAVRSRRLLPHKVKDFVGDFYALPEWCGKAGDRP